MSSWEYAAESPRTVTAAIAGTMMGIRKANARRASGSWASRFRAWGSGARKAATCPLRLQGANSLLAGTHPLIPATWACKGVRQSAGAKQHLLEGQDPHALPLAAAPRRAVGEHDPRPPRPSRKPPSRTEPGLRRSPASAVRRPRPPCDQAGISARGTSRASPM